MGADKETSGEDRRPRREERVSKRYLPNKDVNPPRIPAFTQPLPISINVSEPSENISVFISEVTVPKDGMISCQEHFHHEHIWLVLSGTAYVSQQAGAITVRAGQRFSVPKNVAYIVYNNEKNELLRLLRIASSSKIIDIESCKLSIEPDTKIAEAGEQPRAAIESLEQSIAQKAADLIACLSVGGEEAASLRNWFAQAGHTIVSNSTESVSNSVMKLPTGVPKLWADNTEGLVATAFVAKYYKSWIEARVLSLKALGACDPDLAKAYSNRVYRHPDEAVALVRATRSDRIDDPQEAIDRVREASREASARRRESKRDNPANTPT